MKKDFAIAELTIGKLNSLVKKIMAQTGTDDPIEAVRLINSGEWFLTKSTWNRNKTDNSVELSIVSNGLTGSESIKQLLDIGYTFYDESGEQQPWQSILAKEFILAENFEENKNKVYNLVILFFNKNVWLPDVKRIASEKGLKEANPEIVTLLPKVISEKDFRSWNVNHLVVLNESFLIGGNQMYLVLTNNDLKADSDYGFNKGCGFVYCKE
ncbi:MAG: hypothetical protein EOM85_00005 [Candidatus Moranbacteria bacterium]|nr:hypothetical protein [Candidatus Moranbacteria bacterium]